MLIARTRFAPCAPPSRPPSRSSRSRSSPGSNRIGTRAMAAQRIEIPNRNNHKLVGLLEDPEASSSPPVVVLCHGLLSSKDFAVYPPLSKALNSIGYAAYRFDFSGNGESEGPFEYFNYSHEVEDIRSVVEYLRAQLKRDVVGLVGHSKSGNNVLLYTAKYDDIPLVVNLAGRFHMKDGILDRFGAEIFERLELERAVTVKGRPLTYAQMQERLNTDMYAAATAIKKSKVLTVHGTNDTTIPIRDARVFASVVRGPGHKLFEVEGADHNYGGKEASVIQEIVSFFQS